MAQHASIERSSGGKSMFLTIEKVQIVNENQNGLNSNKASIERSSEGKDMLSTIEKS